MYTSARFQANKTLDNHHQFDLVGGKEVKPFLQLKSTKDRSKIFGFTPLTSDVTGRLRLHDLCADAPAPSRNADEEQEFLRWLLQTLRHSDLASAMIEEAADTGWTIGLDDLEGQDFHLDVAENHMIINNQGLGLQTLRASDYFFNVTLTSIANALRDIWQEKRYGGFEDDYGPESILMLERIRSADCDTLTIAIAWELRGAGQADMWRHVLGSEDGDMAIMFMTSIARLRTGQTIHHALSDTFRQWFASEERMNVCDHETLEYLDDLIAEDGYDAFGHSYLTASRLEILSCLPDRTAYLQNMGRELIADPLYAGMADPINQAHFMQLMHDLESTTVGGVSFRDADLAAKIFPADASRESIDA